jgi:hypothetical protein
MTMRDSTGLTGPGFYVRVASGRARDDREPDGCRVDALAAHGLLVEPACTERAERLGLEDVEGLARQQPPLAGRAACRGVPGVEVVKLKLPRDVDAREAHTAGFAPRADFPSRVREAPSTALVCSARVSTVTHLWIETCNLRTISCDWVGS